MKGAPISKQQAVHKLHQVFAEEMKKDGDASGAAARAFLRLAGDTGTLTGDTSTSRKVQLATTVGEAVEVP